MSLTGDIESLLGRKPSPPPEPAAAASTSPTPSASGRTLLIHGYSASGKDLEAWRKALDDAKISTVGIDIGNYVTLNNEVTIKDLGEAFDRALRFTKWGAGTTDDTFTFDAIVHSTGMLVLRQWLASDPFDRDDPRSRIRRLKHLVGLAPATFGSPQGKQGRSWLGTLIKGNKDLGPDFLNAGDQVLDGLELASRYQWELTHKDLICKQPLFDTSPASPYVAVFIGNIGYTGVSALANSPGSDGTVRWAGCSLDTRKVSLDFRRTPQLTDATGARTRFCITPWVEGRLAAPMIAVDQRNHGSIVSQPAPPLVDFIKRFFALTGADAYNAWQADAVAYGAANQVAMNNESASGGYGGAGWQQLIVHAVDDHGDGITDYNVQLFIGDSLDQSDDPTFPAIPLIVDTYSGDNSFRCFYIRISPEMLALNRADGPQKKMWLELIASSGSTLIEYEAYTGQPDDPQSLTVNHDGGKPVKLDLTPLAQGTDKLLFPYTTTLLELFVEREPLPLNDVSTLFNFLPETPE